ncbi:RING/FYVE/PHD-type zinc finger family protein [Raphanus sativus]|uniref:Uncharacterized protein LOC130504979 n=1 Tax=Raphanus sativus TaxID=3726 RepID=A0A9W3CWD3_RAPSA|nr:uncharacterized protein LOC130504979 [Raphanus sativus]KAJ4868653.1 RING/FYVE/PHD-type zinc finger family protein [Raphanus sativus]
MVFHVACPITCRKICDCLLGFPRTLHGKEDVFLNDIHSLHSFLRDPFDAGVSKEGTVQIQVPKLALFDAVAVGDDSEVKVAPPSTLSKRTVLLLKKKKKVDEDSAANPDSDDVVVPVTEINGEDHHDHHSARITCHMCYIVEVGKSERAKMLSCKCCGKKYHRTCLMSWSQHRDLFDWSSWACPYCRTCEGCGTSGDPKKLMFCKRCDDAYHCDCQQPRHKTVTSGPYLCPKHTKCYSCGSKVPGNGQSLRWFLGHTCCDACGRLFSKGNYCPVCLKVYRDSEATPMVCCDYCQRWVHCTCDGISDERYMQFQVDGHLQYKCSTCRGESYQIKDLEDAAKEIWRRKDIEDKELIASLRASARVVEQTGGAPLRVLRIKSNKSQDSESEKFGKNSPEPPNPVKGKKLVISIGPRKAEASKSKGKHGEVQSEQRSLLGKCNEEKRGLDTCKGRGGDSNGGQQQEELQKDSRPLLKLKIKQHHLHHPERQQEEREAPRIVYERSKSGKGHRSKRKRASSSSSPPPPTAEKSGFNEDEDASLSRDESLLDEMLDASWILKKLGKDAKGKKVQIHDASDDSWEKGVVSEVGGASKLMVTLENGEVKRVELGKQGVRFIPQKQKRMRT